MWEIEHTETTRASRADVWALWSDVSTWPTWDAGIEHVTLDGAFAAGARGRLKPAGSRAVAFSITAVRPLEGFDDETRLPLARLRFSHSLADLPDGGVAITHRVTISGSLTPLFARVIGRDLARDMPDTVRSLARAAEARVAA